MNEDIKYILLEIRAHLIRLKQKCSFPAFNTKENMWEMRAGPITIYGRIYNSETVLESKHNNLPWGKVVAAKEYKFPHYKLEDVAVQLLIGIDDKRYGN